MYIRVKNRENKHNEQVYYLYMCCSKRIKGKVVNIQRYIMSISEQDLKDDNYKELLDTKTSNIELTEQQTLMDKVKEMRLKELSK